MNDFVKAMKIGYYKELRKNGLLTDEQFMKLIEKQGKASSVA